MNKAMRFQLYLFSRAFLKPLLDVELHEIMEKYWNVSRLVLSGVCWPHYHELMMATITRTTSFWVACIRQMSLPMQIVQHYSNSIIRSDSRRWFLVRSGMLNAGSHQQSQDDYLTVQSCSTIGVWCVVLALSVATNHLVIATERTGSIWNTANEGSKSLPLPMNVFRKFDCSNPLYRIAEACRRWSGVSTGR